MLPAHGARNTVLGVFCFRPVQESLQENLPLFSVTMCYYQKIEEGLAMKI